ncbi:MAG: YggT family protein [Firmicutes bacterium]|jgi:YggT family protein|nr:YggT family protein [Bacillota bacterium]
MKFLIKLLSRLYNIILILRILINWLKLSPEAYPPVKFVYRLTEPVLEPLRRVINSKAGFDLSPLVAIILVWLLAKILVEIF